MNIELVDTELAESLKSFPDLDIWTDLVKTREMGAQMRAKMIGNLPPIEAVESEDYWLQQADGPEVWVRAYRPKSQVEPLPALLWIHGGGYCLGSMEADDHMVRQMVREVGFVVISVDYRLAPEHPFPAALNDATAALQWLADNTDTLAVDPARIAIGGISAGAGLAAGLALHTRDKTDIQLAFQFLLCPMIDDRCVTASSHMITDKRVWNRYSNLIAWKHYLHRDKTPEQELYKDVSEYAAASRATNLSGLPSAYIAVGSVDAFVDENRDYAQRLQAAGVSIQFEVFEGGFHGFEFIAPGAGLSKDARESHYGALRIALFDLD
ncbi:alpha/beta hydrolase [Porticoccaceae bacterium]|nr:alpha/beta hydrolase [Porticoccaceae bacterium]